MAEFQKIASFFHSIIRTEGFLEHIRISLSSNLHFEPYSSFREIDTTMCGFITANDIHAYLQSNSVLFDLYFINKLVSQYSTHSDGKLFVGDFMRFILPSTKISLREDALRRKGGELPVELKNLFLDLFRNELEMWIGIERIVYDVQTQGEAFVYRAFAEIDFPRGGFLTHTKIINFLGNYGMFYSESDVDPIIKRLDTDGDSLLSLEEFSMALRGSLAGSNRHIRSSSNGSDGNQEMYLKRNMKKEKEKGKEIEMEVEIEMEKEKEKAKENENENEKEKQKRNRSGSHGDKYSRHKSEKIYSKATDPRSLLGVMIRIILELEEEIDREKKKLIVCPDFNLQEIFSVFDNNSLNFSTESDFLEGLVYLNVKAGKEDIVLLFKHYSEKYNKRLTYEQISRLFLPYLENNLVFKPNELHSSTLKKIKSLIEMHIQHERIFEKYRQQWKRNSMNPESIFRLFGTENVREKELQLFPLDFKESLNDKEVFWVFQYFKKDVNQGITFKEFAQEFSPKSLQRY